MVSGRKTNDHFSLQRLDLANHYLAVPAPQSRSLETYPPPSRVNYPANLGLRTIGTRASQGPLLSFRLHPVIGISDYSRS